MLLQECQSVSDLEVIERVRAGETGLYEMLMRRHNQRLFRVIRSVVISDLEAEDVLQESWVRAYEHLDQFEGRSSFATWVSRIAFHEALARNRRNRLWGPLEDPEGSIVPEATRRQEPAESPEAHAIRAQVGQIVETAVDALPEMYRVVFMLREVEQLNTFETAECLDLSEEAVKTRLHRARALLRRELEARIGCAAWNTYSFLGARCDRTVARVLARIAQMP